MLILTNGIARTLIRNIPSSLGGQYIVAAPEVFTRVVDKVPEKWQLVDYRQDVWDFTPYFTMVNTPLHRYDFGLLPEALREVVKEYIAYLIDKPGNFGKGRIRATRRKLTMLGSMLTYVNKIEPLGIEYARTADFLKAADRGSIKTKYERLKLLMNFIQTSSALGRTYHVDRDAIKDELTNAAGIDKFLVKKHHQNIPRELFDGIIRSMDKTMRNETLPFNDRITAGMVLIQTQLGLRVSELCALKKDCLKWHECTDGVKRPYITYYSMKEAKSGEEAFLVNTICTPLLLETLRYFLPLREKGEFADRTDFLLVYGTRPGAKKQGERYPEDVDLFTSWVRNVCMRYCPETAQKWPGFTHVIHGKRDRKYYTIPSMHNYRVHFAVSLYEQKMPLDFIEAIMSRVYGTGSGDPYYSSIMPSVKQLQQTDDCFAAQEDEIDNYID